MEKFLRNMFVFLVYVLYIFLKALALIIPLLVSVAFLTLLERKLMASIHQRKGPNVVGFFGILQPFADGLKLFIKETIIPTNANNLIFVLAPILTFILSLFIWCVIPFNDNSIFVDLEIGVLFTLAISSLSIYGIIISGWSSNSKWSFLGSLRSAGQMISYEVSLGLIILSVLICSGSLNFNEIVESQRNVWYIFPLFPLSVMFFISGLAETNRAPFDLPEAEAELVSGYSTEYSAMGFALFFLGEYGNMIFMSCLFSLYFLGGWNFSFYFFSNSSYFWLGFKTTFILVLFVWIRAAFPRFRYDQLMRLGWKIFLPFSLSWFLFIVGFLICFDYLI